MPDKVNPAFNILQWLIERYQKVAISGVIFAFAFPFVTTAVLWLDRTGYFPNVYQAEHEHIRKLTATVESQISDMWLQSKGRLDQQKLQLKINHDLIADSLYYLQRTCVNTAQTEQKRNLCLKTLRK
jgi:hypothetical protein